MTEKERIESHIAMCKCCMLADAMKTCPMCLFNIGLAHQVEQVEMTEPIALPIPIHVMMFETV